MTIRVAELFAGVGGFRLGLDGYHDDDRPDMDMPPAGDFETVWANQWEPDGRASKQFAWRCYEERFGKDSCVNEDITKVMDEVEAGEIEIPDVDMVVGGFPCFVAGTPILTEAGYKPIEQVQVGDRVITHRGRLREVVRTGTTTHAETIRITALGSRPIECTPNHPFRASHRSWTFPYGDDVKKKRIPIFSECEWVPAHQLEEHDSFLLSPEIIEPEENPFELTMEECWILGRYVADGHTDQHKRAGRQNSYNHKVILSIGATKVDEAKRHLITYHATIHPHSNNVYRFIITSQRLCDMIDKLGLGHGAINKDIPLPIIMLPRHLLLSFMDGFLSGDGSHYLTSTGQEAWSVTTVSTQLTDSLMIAIQRAYGTHGTIVLYKRPHTTTIEGRTVNQHDTYVIRFRKQQDFYSHQHVKCLADGNIFPINKIESANQDVTVYNLEVAEDHSYCVGPFAVHNCQTFSVARTLSASNGLTGEKGEKGVLWFEIYRFLQQKHPRYCLFENVDRLLKSPASCRGRDFATILCCLAVEGYTVEWRVVNSAEYGFPQRRKRTFIFAERIPEDERPKTIKELMVLMNEGTMASALPHEKATESSARHLSLRHDPYEENHEFDPGGNGKKSPFGDTGVMNNFEVVTCDLKSTYDGSRQTLGDVMVPESEVPSSFYVEGDKLDRWKYLKGSKREKRVTKDGHEWWYSEGAMACPDLPTNPARTILTSEGGASPSRMKHIVEVDGRWRRLVPEELERLQGFPTGWTDGCKMTDNQRAFCMGNALVTGVVHLIGQAIAKRASKKD